MGFELLDIHSVEEKQIRKELKRKKKKLFYLKPNILSGNTVQKKLLTAGNTQK